MKKPVTGWIILKIRLGFTAVIRSWTAPIRARNHLTRPRPLLKPRSCWLSACRPVRHNILIKMAAGPPPRPFFKFSRNLFWRFLVSNRRLDSDTLLDPDFAYDFCHKSGRQVWVDFLVFLRINITPLWRRHHNLPFLKATMAACALVATANGEVNFPSAFASTRSLRP